MRVVIALGGNAMTAPDGRARPEDQRAAVTAAMESVADLVVAGAEVVVTHGNGPQVGNLLVKNEDRGLRRAAGAARLVDDSDLHSHRQIKAAVGGVTAAVTGDPAVFVSVSAAHQGPDGGGPVAAIVDLASNATRVLAATLLDRC